MEVRAILNTNESTWERNLKWRVDFLVSNSHRLPFKGFFSQGLIHPLASFFFSLITCSHKICKQDIYFFENKVGSELKDYWGGDGWSVILQENIENQIPSAWRGREELLCRWEGAEQGIFRKAAKQTVPRSLSVLFPSFYTSHHHSGGENGCTQAVKELLSPSSIAREVKFCYPSHCLGGTKTSRAGNVSGYRNAVLHGQLAQGCSGCFWKPRGQISGTFPKCGTQTR